MTDFNETLEATQQENNAKKQNEETKSNLSGEFVGEGTSSQEIEQNQEPNEVDVLKTEVSSLKEALVRALAESENVRKRHQKEIESMAQFGISALLKDLIEPYEQFFMAIDLISKNENEQTKPILEGIEMTRSVFEKAFVKHGLVRLFPKGEKFNHDFHQAISQVQQEGVEANIIIDVVQAGYVLNGRNIKPALVVVAV